MPTLVLKLAPLQNPERYRQLASALTDLTVDLLGKRREVTAVVIDDLPAARWHIGGAPIEQPTALLEIGITEGTNTREEKAAFIQAAFAELQRQLAGDGALATASYVVVRELPAIAPVAGGVKVRVRGALRLVRRESAALPGG
jgi:4-oxalocrotonate tautomerase